MARPPSRRDRAPARPADPTKRPGDGAQAPAERPTRGGRDPAERTLEERIEELHSRLVLRTNADAHGLSEMLGDRRRLMWVNFLAGLSRGVGFFLGVSLVGGLVLGIFALTFDHAFAAVGLQDITLKRAVTSAYEKYVEIQDLIGEAQKNIDRARAEMHTLPPPAPGPPHTGGPPAPSAAVPNAPSPDAPPRGPPDAPLDPGPDAPR